MSNIDQLTTTTAISSLRRRDDETAKILGRVGIERLGRFQHGDIIYEIEITNGHQETRTHEVDSNDVLDFVTLADLERFENAQFDRELVYDYPLSLYIKKRGRPPKAALQQVGLTSEEESESSSLPNDGIAVAIPVSNSRKRTRSSSPVRGRGRPKKHKTEHLHSRLSRRDRLDHDHIALPQVKKRVKSAFVHQEPLTKNTESHDEDLISDAVSSSLSRDEQRTRDVHDMDHQVPVDAGSSQLLRQSYPVNGDSHEAELDSLSTGGSSHFKSSQLVAAARPIEDKDLEDLHRKHPTKKRGRGRPKKHTLPVQSSEDDELSKLHAQFEARKPDKPKQSALFTSTTALEESSASEDELGSLHERFGIITRRASSSLGNQDSPRSSKIINSHPKTSAVKPSPRNRPGYHAPTHNQHSAQDLSLNASASSESSTSPPSHPERHSTEMKAKTLTQDLIEISSDETESSPPAASSTPRPLIKSNATSTSRSRDIPNAAVIHDDVESVEEASDEETEKLSSNSDENDDDQETATIIDFEIPDIASSQSFRKSVSTSSSGSDSSGEQRIQAREVSKIRRLAGNTNVPPKRQSISMQNISRQVAAQSRAAMEARKQRDGDGKNTLQRQTASTAPGQQMLRTEPSKRYRFPGKSTVPPKSPKISMQNISQQVAAKSRAEVEARKQEQAAKAALAESSDSSPDDSDSYSIPPDSPQARKPVSSTLASRTQQREAPGGVTKQNHPKSFPLAFKRFAAAHQQQQQKQQQPPLPSRKAAATTGPFAQSTGKSHNEPQSRSQAKSRPQQTPSRRSSSPFIPAHRQSSISLGETPPHRSRIAVARKPRGPSIDLEEPKPRPASISSKPAPSNPTDNSNQRSKPSDGSAKADKKKKKSRRVSMTPLFPSAAGKGSPVKKGRVPFSTREFEGEV